MYLRFHTCLNRMLVWTALATGSGLSSCTAMVWEDPLCDEEGNVYICVANDWRHDPTANPEGMRYLFFSPSWTAPWEAYLPGRDGGTLLICPPPDSYDCVCVSEKPDSVVLQRMSRFETLTVAAPMPKNGAAKADGTSRDAPGAVWGCVDRSIGIQPDRVTFTADGASYRTRNRLVFYPWRLTADYTVTVLDIINAHGIATVSGGLDGMAPGVVPARGEAAGGEVNLLFNARCRGDTVSGAFHTFGDALSAPPNTLHLYVTLTDGRRVEGLWDVTDQVKEAPDPSHVDIVVRGFELPEPGDPASGFDVKVDGWESHTIDYRTSLTHNSQLPTPNPQPPTPNSQLKTQDSRLKTQDSRLKTQDSRLKTQDSRLKIELTK